MSQLSHSARLHLFWAPLPLLINFKSIFCMIPSYSLGLGEQWKRFFVRILFIFICVLVIYLDTTLLVLFSLLLSCGSLLLFDIISCCLFSLPFCLLEWECAEEFELITRTDQPQHIEGFNWHWTSLWRWERYAPARSRTVAFRQHYYSYDVDCCVVLGGHSIHKRK